MIPGDDQRRAVRQVDCKGGGQHRHRAGERPQPVIENLEIRFGALRIDTGEDAPPGPLGCRHLMRKGFQRGDADDRQASGDAKAACGREPNAQAGEVPRPHGHADPIERGEVERGRSQRRLDQGQQQFAVAARGGFVVARDHGTVDRDGDGQMRGRAIEGENPHRLFEADPAGLAAAVKGDAARLTQTRPGGQIALPSRPTFASPPP